MIAAALPASVVAAGDIVARTSQWAVTTETTEKAIYPTLPNGKSIRVIHYTYIIACHHLASGKVVRFSKKKTNWYDSRKEAIRMRKKTWHSPTLPVSRDCREQTISRSEVVSEVARMGGGGKAVAIVAVAS